MDFPHLYQPIDLSGLSLKNRLVMAPMCQYSAVDGLLQNWHFRHYVERAQGGVSLLLVEATAVSPEGRISPADLGIWSTAHRDTFRHLVDQVHAAGAKIGIQLAHAGRKASTQVPWKGNGRVELSQGGWPVGGPGDLPFDPSYPVPKAMTNDELNRVVDDFAAAARRAVEAGFDVVEVHAAHGYLVHQFLSPLTNQRTDDWGGTPEKRRTLAVEITRAVRAAVGPDFPLFLRLSATDWVDGGWDVSGSIALLEALKDQNLALVDVSSGGVVPGAKIAVGPGYQVPFSAQIRRNTGLKTGAVGLITEAKQAELILRQGEADVVLLGRQLLRDPYFPARHAPAGLRTVPAQYERAF